MTLENIIFDAAADGLIDERQADELVERINSEAEKEIEVAMGARCFVQDGDGWQLTKLARSREDGGLFTIRNITV